MSRPWHVADAAAGAVALVLGAVLTTSAAAQQPALNAGTELKVVATIRPIHSIAAAVLDGIAEPRLLVAGTASPHTFTLKPSDVKALGEADVLFRVSETLEPFTVKLAQALPKRVRLVTLEKASGLTLLPLRTGATFEAHDHAAAKGGHGHGHAHGHKSGSSPAGIDGHLWLDPANAKILAAHIASELALIAPHHGDRLKANAAAVSVRLDALAAEIETTLKPLAGRSYVVFHDAYQYFERRYGLTPAGSVTISPDVAPSAKRVSELRRKIVALKAACIFAEPQFEPRLIVPIIEGTAVRRGTLDPLGAAIPAGPGQYPALLRALADNLKSCLTDPA